MNIHYMWVFIFFLSDFGIQFKAEDKNMATVESLRMYQINIFDYAKIEKIEKNLNNYGIVFDNIENYAIMVNMQDSDFS